MTPSIDALLARIDACAGIEDFHLQARAQLELLKYLVTPFAIVDQASYEAASKIRCMLSSLDCYTLNFENEHQRLVGELLARWSHAASEFNDTLLVKDPDARLLARYLLWTKTFTRADDRACFLLARKHGLLARLPCGEGRFELVVVGLRRKVGDNTFRTSRRGGQHRCFIETIGRQGFYPAQRFPLLGEEAARFMNSLPELDETYHGVSIGDGKYRAKASSFTQPEIQRLYVMLMGADVEQLQAEAARSPVPPAGPAPEQIDWLGA